MYTLSFSLRVYSLPWELLPRKYSCLFVYLPSRRLETNQHSIFSATMVTAILPSLTNEADADKDATNALPKIARNPRHSAAFSVESEITITPERYTRSISQERDGSTEHDNATEAPKKPSALAGYVGLFTGCGALVALSVFLPLPAKFGEIDGVTPGEAVSYSFYVVGAVSFAVAIFVFVGLRNLKGEEGKGWRVLIGRKSWYQQQVEQLADAESEREAVCPCPNDLGLAFINATIAETHPISSPHERFNPIGIHGFENRPGLPGRVCSASIDRRHLTFYTTLRQYVFYRQRLLPRITA